MSLVLLLNLVGVGFLVASAFNGNFKRVNSMGAGLAILGFTNLILPAVA